MKSMKKTLAVTGAVMSLYAGGMLIAGNESMEAPTSLCQPIAHAAERQEWQDDVAKATKDDTMAFNVYIGKPIQACVEELKKDGFVHAPNEPGIFYIKKKTDYIYGIFILPHATHSDIVGNYSIRFYAKTSEMADEIYMQAEKNFSYNFGRPNVKQGTTNAIWFLNENFSITVEYNEYDPRMPLVQYYYPHEVAINREIGDFKKFFVPVQ